MPLPSLPALVMIGLASGLLAGCGGTIAPDAPELLSRGEIDAALTHVANPSGGAQATSGLAQRGAALRARAAAAQRADIASDLTEAERRRLLRRAEALKDQQD